MEKRISDILKELRVPVANLGYQYIRTAIRMILQNEDWLYKITGPRGLYNEVAEVHNSTFNRVERSIRHGIECSFDNADKETLIKYFGQAEKKLTNKNFIAAIVEEIRLTEV